MLLGGVPVIKKLNLIELGKHISSFKDYLETIDEAVQTRRTNNKLACHTEFAANALPTCKGLGSCHDEFRRHTVRHEVDSCFRATCPDAIDNSLCLSSYQARATIKPFFRPRNASNQALIAQNAQDDRRFRPEIRNI